TIDIMRIQNFYPGIAKALAMRLGEANARRRQYLKYRQDHAAKPKSERLSENLPSSNEGKIANQIGEDVDAPAKPTISVPQTTRAKSAPLLFGTEATESIPDRDIHSVSRRPPS